MIRSRQNQKENRRSGAGMIFNLLLTIVPVYLFAFSYLKFYKDATYLKWGNYLFYFIYSFVLILFMVVYSSYRVRQFRTRELIFSFALASFLTNLIMYFVMCLIARRLQKPLGVVITTLVQWVLETGIYVLARMSLPLMEPPVRVLYIRDETTDDRIEEKIDSRRTRYQIGGEISCDMTWTDIRSAIDHYGAVLIGDIPQQMRRDIIAYCYRTGKEALLMPDMPDILLCSALPMMMGDSLIYDLNTQGEDLAYQTIKRAMDIVASLLGLMILSPLMLVTAAAIKIQDGGPVFYRQIRLTRDGKSFQLTKFRSMVVNAESATGAVLAEKEDRRITRVGRFIRATRIDELPQLWNILMGDMTLVGPRPERPEFYETICAEYPEFEYRLKVKAGLTGYAQLYGKYNTTFTDKARLDVYYIQHASLLLDLKLIFYTLKIIFIKESTEGVEKKTKASEKQTIMK